MKSYKKYSRFVATALMVGMLSTGPVLAQDSVRINFRDADIRSVIESVAEVTGRSFVLDPRVKGKVTIIAPTAINSDLLYEAILSSLQVQGFQAVQDGAITRILPFSQAFQISSSGVSNELETQVIRVDHVRATELLPVLKPLMSKGALLQAYDTGNYLIATDTISQLKRIKQIMRELDRQDQSSVDVVVLKHISAAEAIHIAGQMKHLQQQQVSIVEDSFNNRVIIGGSRTARNSLRMLLGSLDVPSQQSAGVEVIYLNYAQAKDVKPVLDGMLQSDTFLRLAGEAIGSDGGAQAASGYKIEADESNNALVIAASSTVISEIKSVVRKLDRERPQVLIEAVIAEVSEEQAQRLGTDLVYAGSGGGYLTSFDNLLLSVLGSITPRPTESRTTTIDGVTTTDTQVSAGVTINPSTLGTALAGASPTSTAVFGDFDRDKGTGFGVLIQALKTDGDTTILSTPSLVTLNNEEAELSVGQDVPLSTGTAPTNNGGVSNPFTTIKREQVGIKLKVKPQISDTGSVRMEIAQESSDVLSSAAAAAVGASDLILAKRTIDTNVMVNNGEILVLGGLMSDSLTESERKVPILGDIPLMGRLFKSTSKDKSQRVLMMFIRPTILRNKDDAKAATLKNFDYLKSSNLASSKEQEKLFSRVFSEYNDSLEQNVNSNSDTDQPLLTDDESAPLLELE